MMSHNGFTFRREVRSLFTLAWPLVGSNLLISAMHFIDIMMAGHISGRDLAAVGIGSNVWLLLFLASQGVLTALSPLVSQHYGAGNHDEIGRYVRHGLLLALPLSLLILAALQFLTAPLLVAMGIDPALREMGERFVHAISWGAPAVCCFLVFRFVLEGMGLTRLILGISVVGLLSNVAGNVVFMYGYLGAPALGGVGCGVASALSMWLMLLLMLGYILGSRRFVLLRRAPSARPRPLAVLEILRLGLPISGTVLAENGFFIAVTLMMGTISIGAVAAHQIAMNYTSIMYMIPMALAAAISVRVGHAVGEGNLSEARWRGVCGILVCFAVMTVSALFLLIFHRQIALLYSADHKIAALAASLLLIATAFQLSDGLQVGCGGALRGFKDTRLPLLICIVAYWLIGFPLAWRAAHRPDAAAQQVWWGFVIGLTVAALLMLARYLLLSRHLARAPSRRLATKGGTA
ncbi:MATE family efflux transporter [Pandoraea cepalis]|uniref:Multidrug-efflux transporter n=1 Tax=Pandoraea cepalis TaxID=2508294 RepID=A0A5E4XCM2_9BURK|nr:MATE family efflux transporter [Pandoraea cepalis]VVE33878.1 Multidrug resistance protein NorM [Pandoraea cepalis]